MEWQDFVGNSDSIGRLQKLLQEKRMPGALLLLGPQGVGKFLAAEMVAAAIFFDSPSEVAKAVNHPDMIIIQPDGQNIKIEQIRKMQLAAALAPDKAQHRIIIIDDADKMTVQAANSLLKTLEEPAGEAMFILVAENRSLLLDTVISRCLTVEFQPIERSELARYMAEKYNLPAEQAYTLTMLSGGSLGRAVQLTEDGALNVRLDALGFVTSIIAQRRSGQYSWTECTRLAENDRPRLLLIMEALLTIWRDLLVMDSGSSAKLLYNVDKERELRDFGAEISGRVILGAIELTNQAMQMLRANGNQLLIMERFMIKMQDL